MLSTTDFRRGLKIELEGVPYEIVEFQHYKPGKGGAIVRTKLKNVLNGRVVERTFRSGEKVDKPDLVAQDMQFLYHEGTDLVFMDMSSYEQVHVPGDTLAEKGGYLLDGMEIQALLYNGQIIDLNLPASLVYEVVATEPGVQGDRVGNATKPATLNTGLTVQVPLFVNEGEQIKVDTRTGAYISRA
ncbi:Elongation factor P [Desulfovibrio sp. X2]|uniref:elongation factor P n=1 Tax=Desulfovibrio sp. X2 TaxID=941449 RepID=UPI0003588471|nr:elongation factor P [Desulfovibrio sp. X2]EPR42277.1 Elongation factor P [Desulfovibrio sp. X2]